MARDDRSQLPRGRTEEERERDREERALRASARRRERGERGTRRWLTGVLGALALVVVIAGAWLAVRSLRDSRHSQTVAQPVVVKVVIPEGETRLRIAEIAAADGLTGSYVKASERSALLSPRAYGAPRGTPDLEGFLFPATYELYAGVPASRLVAEQLEAFREHFGAEQIRRAHELGVTPYQLLTVASMVEREAQVPGDRAKIAAVIYNRLRIGMALGIDATIYYAIERARGIATYTGELTESQLHIDSPYNTRTHRGLPPTPISNPGTASMQAAAHPAHVPYLYYVAGADGCGEQVFSATYARFEEDAAAYDAAVKKNGGRPPVCRKK
ncbi:MAG: endolytic transglycosylase MltG [Solirubrobacteraceae bacterium]